MKREILANVAVITALLIFVYVFSAFIEMVRDNPCREEIGNHEH